MYDFDDLMTFYVEQGYVKSEMASEGVDALRPVDFDHDAYPYAGSDN